MTRPDAPELGEIILAAIRAHGQRIHTSIPARVISYDAANQTARVQPAVKRGIRDEDGTIVYKDPPELPNVPIMFPRSGDTWISWQIAAGDWVMLHFAESEIDGWRTKGNAPTEPGTARRHSYSAAYAIPCGFVDGEELPNVGNTLVVEHPSEIKLGAGATDHVALAALVLQRLQDLYDAINNATPGSGDGGAALKTAIIAALDAAAAPNTWPEAVAAAKTKAE